MTRELMIILITVGLVLYLMIGVFITKFIFIPNMIISELDDADEIGCGIFFALILWPLTLIIVMIKLFFEWLAIFFYE